MYLRKKHHLVYKILHLQQLTTFKTLSLNQERFNIGKKETHEIFQASFYDIIINFFFSGTQ